MDGPTKTALEPVIREIAGLFRDKRGQFLLVGPDMQLLECARSLICEKTKYAPETVTMGRQKFPDRKIFFLNLAGGQSLEYQSLLYYYLELPLSHDCFVCLVSTSSMCLNSLEKRVRSRFKNRVFFVPYLEAQSSKPRPDVPAGVPSKAEAAQSLPHVCISPSLAHKARREFMEKYALEPFTLSYLLDLFEPIHFALIIASRKHKLTPASVLDAYRKATVNINEIKGAGRSNILYCYYDLVDSDIIGAGGALMVDFGECQDFILKNCPLFLRRMLGKS